MMVSRSLLLLFAAGCSLLVSVSGLPGQRYVAEDLPWFGGLEDTQAAAVGDVNGDGLEDFVHTRVRNGRDDVLVRYRVPNQSHPARAYEFSGVTRDPVDLYRPVVVADFDGDGRAEIASGARNADVFVLWSGRGRFRGKEIIDPDRGAMFLQAVDINRDGKLDLLCADRHESQEVVW